jgi:hypothetical protein
MVVMSPPCASLTPTQLAAFWSKVDKSGDCWIWTAARRGLGYGNYRAGNRTYTASRLSFLHSCDNPPCVRPSHLFAGTHADNMRDCVAKGRCGSKPGRPGTFGNARLTAEQVAEVRAAYRPRGAGSNSRELAQKFSISQRHIRAIARGDRW